jgi:hypothetical protein
MEMSEEERMNILGGLTLIFIALVAGFLGICIGEGVEEARWKRQILNGKGQALIEAIQLEDAAEKALREANKK